MRNLVSRSATPALLAAMAALGSSAYAQWVGDTDNEFLNAANWPSDTLPSTNATWQVNGTGTQGNSTLNITGGLTFTGTSGKLAFGSTSGDMTLGGGPITLFQGTGGDIIRTDSTGTTTLASNIILGDGTDAGTSAVTYTLSSTSLTTGLLKVTGNISGGTKPGPVTVSFGSTDSIDGNYEVTGNISKGGATLMNLTKRGDGTLTLSGTNEVASLNQNVAASKIVIAGTTNLKPASESLNNWGGGNMAVGTGPTIEVQTGATLTADYARDIRAKISITGGTVNIQSTSTRLTWQLGNTEVFNMTGGEMNYLNASTGQQFGVNFSNVTGSQSGGTFTVNGRGASGQNFNIASSTFSASYALSGGTLDVKGSNGTSGWINLTADAAGTYTSTLTLSGTGKLISRYSPGSTGGIVGNTAGAKQILALNGGTLVAGRIEAANLRGSEAGANGTLVNNGTIIAPGDVTDGLIGRTNIVGNFTQTTGTLRFDLGGTTASTVFSEAANLGTFDNLTVTGTGNFTLSGGDFRINLVNGFTPLGTDIFKIIDVVGTATFENSFVQIATGLNVYAYLGNDVVGSFTLAQAGDDANDLVLTNFQAAVIPEPSAFAALAGLAAVAAVGLRRRRRA